MNYFDLYSSYPDHTIAAAWDVQVKEAAQTPGLGEILQWRGKYIPAGDLTFVNSNISKNSAVQGGGVFNQGTLTIENSVISGNKAFEDGGGIFNSSNYNAPASDLSLVDSTITENRAKDSGGGLANYGSFTMSNSIISDNRARFGPDTFP